MRLLIKLLVCLCLLPASTFSQERIRKMMVGPNNDRIRIVVAFIEPSQEAYSMQSMIIDVDSVKNGKEQPSPFQVDLTSTVRSLSTGEKRQKILLLRWKKTGEIELKCDGKWIKRDVGSMMDKIVEATKAVIQRRGPRGTRTANGRGVRQLGSGARLEPSAADRPHPGWVAGRAIVIARRRKTHNNDEPNQAACHFARSAVSRRRS